MKVELFSYDLPTELIAQTPAEERGDARLLVVPDRGAIESQMKVSDLAERLPEGSLVIVNDTRVLPARLLGQKVGTGGRVEIFLVKRVGVRPLPAAAPGVSAPGRAPAEAVVWKALGKASKALRFGVDMVVGELVVRLLGRADDDGLVEVALYTKDGSDVDDAVRAVGHVPLPPYIKRPDRPEDRERYQTIYAKVDGAIAAPTAGLHLTRATLEKIAARGGEVAYITLHVGLGTFRPVTVDDFDAHPMHTEPYAVPKETVQAIERARARKKPVVAIGTTVARALEAATDRETDGNVHSGAAETRLLIQPGYDFRVVDLLFTNFHLPKSTLLALVSAFGGRQRVLNAYRAAIAERFRFYSYGDAMLLWPEQARATPRLTGE